MKTAIASAMMVVFAAGLPVTAHAGDESDTRTIARVQRFEWKAPFTDMSPQGLALIGEAMKRERMPANAEQVRRARQKVLELLVADTLDIGAIRKAQAEERALAIKEHALAQEKMLQAYQQLSLADRRAFANGMRMQEERMLRHLDRARERMRRMQEQIERDVERVRKETGNLWIVLPPLSPDSRQGS